MIKKLNKLSRINWENKKISVCGTGKNP